jgi:hypothetical protein
MFERADEGFVFGNAFNEGVNYVWYKTSFVFSIGKRLIQSNGIVLCCRALHLVGAGPCERSRDRRCVDLNGAVLREDIEADQAVALQCPRQIGLGLFR